jgi:AcrR family transcriptional regulator
MESASRPRSTRDRPAKPPLSEDVILDAALRILHEEGLEAVTMRRLAAELDTGAASLYVYIAGRDELREAMLDRISAAVQLERPDPAHWREQLHRLMMGILNVMEDHPGIAMVAVGNPPTTERVIAVAENMAALLRAGGMGDRDVAWACDILPLIVTASAVEADVRRTRTDNKDEFLANLARVYGNLPAERFPTVLSLLEYWTTGTRDERFRFAIDVILDGLVARAAREQSV